MNDKQQLAAIGEQLAEMGERMGLQVQPMCMAKRIEELEAQVRVMAELLQKARVVISESMPFFSDRSDCYKVEEIRRLPSIIDTALASQSSDTTK